VKEDVPSSPYMYGLDAAGSLTAAVSMLVEEGGWCAAEWVEWVAPPRGGGAVRGPAPKKDASVSTSSCRRGRHGTYR